MRARPLPYTAFMHDAQRAISEAPHPDVCADMTEVRLGVDAVDRQLVALLARRQGYMEAAARIKPALDMVRDDERIADVMDKVRAEAEANGLDAKFVNGLWPALVELSIAHETIVWRRLRDR